MSLPKILTFRRPCGIKRHGRNRFSWEKNHRVSRNLAKLLSNQHFGVGAGSQELEPRKSQCPIYTQISIINNISLPSNKKKQYMYVPTWKKIRIWGIWRISTSKLISISNLLALHWKNITFHVYRWFFVHFGLSIFCHLLFFKGS